MNWIQCLDLPESGLTDLLYFGYCLCLDIPESGFAVLWTLFTSSYSVWINQRVDLLYFGYCPYLGADSLVV